VFLGIVIVFISCWTLGKLPGIKVPDAVATGGLFGAVSGSTVAVVLPSSMRPRFLTKPGQRLSIPSWTSLPW
jgi:hypothetical protein